MSSSPPSIRRTQSPSPSRRTLRPTTLRATYSNASLRSVAAPSTTMALAQTQTYATTSVNTVPQAAHSYHEHNSKSSSMTSNLSISSSLTHTSYTNDAAALTSHDSEFEPSTPSTSATSTAMVIPVSMDRDIPSEAQSVAQSLASTSTSTSTSDLESPVPTGGLVVTGDIDPVEADGVVDSVPGEAKTALRDHLRRRLSEAGGVDGIGTGRTLSSGYPSPVSVLSAHMYLHHNSPLLARPSVPTDITKK